MKTTLRLFMISVAALVFLLALAHSGFAADPAMPKPDPAPPRVVEITIKDHRFDPSQLTIEPGAKIILRVINKDESAEEFESRYLKREKVIPGNSSADIAIGPLKPGVYDFMGEFHQETAQGRITVPQTGTPYTTSN